MVILATIGYGMNQKLPAGIKKAPIFRQCLEEASVDLVLDTRYSPWGGYWNPKEIGKILEGTDVRYVYKNGSVKLHELFGVPKAMRGIRPFSDFAGAYSASLSTRPLDPFSALDALLKEYMPRKLAILCCEPFVPARDNCHRFVLADILVEKGIVEKEVEHLSMDATWGEMEH